jgi:hypothetical protein
VSHLLSTIRLPDQEVGPSPKSHNDRDILGLDGPRYSAYRGSVGNSPSCRGRDCPADRSCAPHECSAYVAGPIAEPVHATRVDPVERVPPHVTVGLPCQRLDRVARQELHGGRVVVAGPQVEEARLGVGVLAGNEESAASRDGASAKSTTTPPVLGRRPQLPSSGSSRGRRWQTPRRCKPQPRHPRSRRSLPTSLRRSARRV